MSAGTQTQANAKGYIYRLQRTTKKQKRLNMPKEPPDSGESTVFPYFSVCDHSLLFYPLPHYLFKGRTKEHLSIRRSCGCSAELC